MGGKVLDYEAKDILKQGRAEGAREMMLGALRKGNSAEAVADFMGVSLEEVQEIASQLEN